ncbi:MAG: M48 family metallopeptidase [Alphaproteobacteria bacterium]|nr:M48 family metallopeptidase [Alphaproteobacteria bacterium]
MSEGESENFTAIKPYPNEPKLFVIAAIISTFAWLHFIVGTVGMSLAILGVFFLVYLFVQSGFVSHLRGTGALVSSEQFPDIHAAVERCAKRFQFKKTPTVYILHMNGMFNAFALRFLRQNYIVLLSDIVDAMDENPDALNFYIGHEMGHLHRNHNFWAAFLSPALILPLLGAGYSRAREYTCDRYGAACCDSLQSVRFGLAALAVGGKKCATLDQDAYLQQVQQSKGFWMSFHELIADYPWLVKRFARVNPKEQTKIPKRNPFAYVFAIFVPQLSVMSFIVLYGAVILWGGFFQGQDLIWQAKENGAMYEQNMNGDMDVNPELNSYQNSFENR